MSGASDSAAGTALPLDCVTHVAPTSSVVESITEFAGAASG